MANDEFSVNELEPERNTTDTQENTQKSNERVSDAALLHQEALALEEKKAEEVSTAEEASAEEFEGPTIKEVIANSVNPDYQGPTAKEIVVNSVKVDNTKKKNFVGLFVLIFVLLSIGIIASLEVFSDDKKKEIDYLDGLPEWVDIYNEYLKKEYEEIVAYNVAFLDFDFDDKPEALINYQVDGKTVYEVIDCLDEKFIELGEISSSNVLLFYSFDKEDVIWYVNTSTNDMEMNLIDLKKRLLDQDDYETNLSLDSLSQFKSNHFALSYQIKYTKISFRTMEQNLADAVKLYDKEKSNVDGIVENTIEKYSDDI